MKHAVRCALMIAVLCPVQESVAGPQIRSMTISSTQIVIIGQTTHTLTVTMIPSAQRTTPAKIETWVNAWLATNLTDMQARVHVFSVSPFTWTVGTWNQGLTIDPNWWVEQ